jgi:hypothetical protein
MGRPSNAEKEAKRLTELAGNLSEVAEVLITPEMRIEALEAHCLKLESAISRIAVLTGNGNHLRELGIERWVPGKKDMNKKYA